MYLQSLGLLSDLSSDFVIITNRLVKKAVRPLIHCFPEAIVKGADYGKVFVVIASVFLMAVN